jgi:hypothetical protein
MVLWDAVLVLCDAVMVQCVMMLLWDAVLVLCAMHVWPQGGQASRGCEGKVMNRNNCGGVAVVLRYATYKRLGTSMFACERSCPVSVSCMRVCVCVGVYVCERRGGEYVWVVVVASTNT